MNNNPALAARQAHRLVQAGLAMFVLAAVIGLFVQKFALPRVALSAHLIGILQGVFFIALGSAWSRLVLGPGLSRLAFWLLLYGGVAALGADLLAAAWGAGGSIVPLAAGSAKGTAFQEALVNAGFRSAGAAIIIAPLLLLWGLRRPAEAR